MTRAFAIVTFPALAAFVIVSCTSESTPTSAPLSGSSTHTAASPSFAPNETASPYTITGNPPGLSLNLNLNLNEDEDFNCTNVDEVHVRFSYPGWIDANAVGLFVSYAGVADIAMSLLVWWDYENAPEEYENIPLDPQDVQRNDTLLDIEKIIEHTYNVSRETTRRVRVHLLLADQTGNCARVRDVTVRPPGEEAAPPALPLVCQPFNLSGFACPSGATQFCASVPIDPSDAAQAQQACELCYGAPCFLETADCAGPAYGPNPAGSFACGDAYFGYQNGCSGGVDGRIWSICFSGTTTYGRWAP